MPGVKKYNIVNVKVFDGYKFVPGHIIVNGSTIGENRDAAGAEPIDGNGGYLIPGFIDCHVHLHAGHPECMYQMRDHGITSAMDMETWPLEGFNELRSLPGVPDVKGAGLAAQYNRLPPNFWPPESKVETPRDAHIFVAHRARENLDFIKLISDPPPVTDPTQTPKRGIDEATMTALCVCADQHDMLTIAHATEHIGFNLALKSGVKIITHTPLTKGKNGGEGELNAIIWMAALQRVCVPTLIMMKGTAENRPIEGYSIENAIESVKQMHRLGVPILAGTDANPNDAAPASPKYGSSLHEEFKLLKQAGMTNVEVLRAATVLPSQHLKLPDRGVIASGYRSDLVLLSADPTVDIGNAGKIVKIWVKGEMFAPGDRPHDRHHDHHHR